MRLGAAVLLAIAATSLLRAQDVLVGDIQWWAPETTAPVPKRGEAPRPAFPPDMKKSDEIGYVIVSQGRVPPVKGVPPGNAMYITGTHESFIRAVRAEFNRRDVINASYGWRNPADGQPVWQSFIFNPRSAATGNRDATPRLLEIVPIVSPINIGGKAGGNVWLNVSLDATGAITAVTAEQPLPDDVLALVRTTLARWKFTPARRGGQPVSAEVRLPVFSQGRFTVDPPNARPVVVPRIISSPPFDPSSVIAQGRVNGEVVVEFDVDVDGTVSNPVILRSTNPALNEPAIARVLGSQVQPGTRDGKPERMKSRMGYSFNRNDTADFAKVNTPAKAQENLPEDIRFDVAPQPRGVVPPVYPYALLREQVKGRARVALSLDDRGKVVRVEVVEASHPEFGQALAAAAQRFEFEPALKGGHRAATMVSHQHEFDPRGPDNFPRPEELSLLARELKRPQSIVAAEKLDAALTPISRAAPLAPLAIESGAKGRAVVEFLVDETGHARLPRVVEASAPEFGYAAVQAVAAWLFQPPRAGGKAAVVRVQVLFNFDGAPH